MTAPNFDRAIGALRLLSAAARWQSVHGPDPEMRGLPRERAARLVGRSFRKYDRELAAARPPGISAVPDIAVRQIRDRSARPGRHRVRG